MEEITEIRMKILVVRGLQAAADIILPRTCAVCGRTLNLDERHLCLPCLAELPLTHMWTRDHNSMADRFNRMIEDSMDDYPTDRILERYAYAAALFFYDGEGDYRRIPHRLKYQGDIRIGRYFGRLLGRKLAGAGHFKDVDAVIPVPLHWTRKWKRGYNQAEVIANEIAAELGATMRTDILRRQRRTRTQTKVAPGHKSANVAGAFRATIPQTTILPYRHILLVDDVFTTGSTLMACFTALRAVLPPSVRISVATLAFVGGA